MIKNMVGFRNELEKVNEWWLTKRVKEAEKFSIRREKFQKVEQELTPRRIVVIIGPRRVGKSVLAKQIIEWLIKEGTNPRNILYYSLDDPALFTYSDNLMKDLVEYFLENIAKEGRKYIFLDEIHLFKDWYRWVKSYYDRYLDIKLIVSGSSSMAIQKDANKYLRGRIVEIELFPLSFREFLKLYGKEVEKFSLVELLRLDEFKAREILYTVKAPFEEYLLVGGFPEWFELRKEEDALDRWFKRLVEDVPKKAIYEDIANIFGIKNPKLLELMFAFISANQSKVLAYETINDIVKLDRGTLINYLEFLKSAYLVIEILKFAGVKEQLKAKKKYLIIDQGLRNANLKEYEVREDNVGFVIENLIGTKLFFDCKQRNENLFYWKGNEEVDFVIKGKEVLPVEVKYHIEINKRDLKNLLNFLKKFGCERGIVVTKDLFKKENINSKEILLIPARLFLLTF